MLSVPNEAPRVFAPILWNQHTNLPCFCMCAVRKMDGEAQVQNLVDRGIEFVRPVHEHICAGRTSLRSLPVRCNWNIGRYGYLSLSFRPPVAEVA